MRKRLFDSGDTPLPVTVQNEVIAPTEDTWDMLVNLQGPEVPVFQLHSRISAVYMEPLQFLSWSTLTGPAVVLAPRNICPGVTPEPSLTNAIAWPQSSFFPISSLYTLPVYSRSFFFSPFHAGFHHRPAGFASLTPPDGMWSHKVPQRFSVSFT